MNELAVTIQGKLPRILLPNRGQRNARAKGRARAQAKNDAFLCTREVAWHRSDLSGIDRAVYHIELGKAHGEQSKDQDNLIAACKGHLDGVAKALDVDDRGWTLGTVTQVRDPDRVGYVRITLVWAQESEVAA